MYRTQAEKGTKCDAAVRPENISFCPSSESGENVFKGIVNRASYTGDMIDYEIEFNGVKLRARGSIKGRSEAGDNVYFRIDPDHTPALFA